MCKKILFILLVINGIAFSSNLLAAACPYLNRAWPAHLSMEYDGDSCIVTTPDNIRLTVWDPNYKASKIEDCFEHYITNASLYNLTLFQTQVRSDPNGTYLLCEYHYYGKWSYMDLFIKITKEDFCPLDSHWEKEQYEMGYVCNASNYVCDFKLDGLCNKNIGNK